MKTRPLSKPNKLRLSLLSGAALCLSVPFSEADESPDSLVRVWKSGDGEYSVQASLIAFNQSTKRVTLQKEDASVVVVPLAQLSTADQSYITEKSPKPARKEATDGSIKLYGIGWQSKIEDALTLAAGETTPSDDRPVMWFRVLGELDGGM